MAPGDPTEDPAIPAFDDPLFPELLLNEEVIPVYLSDDLSILDRENEREAAGPGGLRQMPGRRLRTDGREEEGEETSLEVELQRPNLIYPVIPIREGAEYNPMAQAFHTGESILTEFSGIRGSVTSPFLPPTHRREPLLRLGAVRFFPHVSVGVLGISSKGSGANNPGDHVGGFFQAGFHAALRERKRLSASLDYTIGMIRTNGGSENSSKGLDQHLSLRSRFSFPDWPKLQFGLGVEYAGLSSVDRDVGEETERILATVSLGATYQ
ncbi:MAG: hypothetical protein EOP84_20105, partial [Verrucomicrobiaceae bacterium]